MSLPFCGTFHDCVVYRACSSFRCMRLPLCMTFNMPSSGCLGLLASSSALPSMDRIPSFGLGGLCLGLSFVGPCLSNFPCCCLCVCVFYHPRVMVLLSLLDFVELDGGMVMWGLLFCAKLHTAVILLVVHS